MPDTSNNHDVTQAGEEPTTAADGRDIDAAFGVFDGLYEPGYLDRLRSDADLT